ncbi:SDR family oxidoreductase [Sporichthya sp.]|uniref:SDR family NAD(P)-dependent oxidoreductase n=1 Tax=Sporichthya sp. TaxID=65475 RepID=UPI0017D062BD|nr:SDR family oxidoreductase [Sporichthya sp.]MBA3741417.1 SDR family oxidoreductase [Sporichthya sp.]
MTKLMQDKVAVVTGGASGLGRATVEIFAAHGAKVVIADVNDDRGAGTVKAVEAAGGEAVYLRTDVALSADVRAVVECAEDTYGKLDVMVANAGISGPIGNLEDIEDEDFRHVFEVNFFGVWRCLKYAVPAIRRAGGGSMTTTSSLGGVQTLGGIRRGPYSSTKAAVNAATSYFAVELAKDRIRVNCVAAGGMSTNISESYPLTPEERAAMDRVPSRPKRVYGESMFPICEPHEVAQVHLFLNSDLASFVNGQVILADAGGFDTTMAWAFPKALTLDE